MSNGRDCPHGRQVGKCDTCDLIAAEIELQKVTTERDALAVQVEALRREIQSAADWFSAYWPELNKAQCDRIRQMDSVANKTPQHHLRELRAEAGWAGYIAAMLSWMGLKNPDGINFPDADRYAEQIRKGGAE